MNVDGPLLLMLLARYYAVRIKLNAQRRERKIRQFTMSHTITLYIYTHAHTNSRLIIIYDDLAQLGRCTEEHMNFDVSLI